MSPELRPKALAVIRSGRLTVMHTNCRKQAHVIDEVIAKVQSSRQGGPTYAIDYLDGIWDCTCRAEGECAHIAAVQLVTGHAA
jgi:hypothetical protein